MTAHGDDNEPTDYNLYGNAQRGAADYPPSVPQLAASPFYLPNLIAAIVASISTVVGSVGTWASASTVGSISAWAVSAWAVWMRSRGAC